jgi:hypothetical protein
VITSADWAGQGVWGALSTIVAPVLVTMTVDDSHRVRRLRNKQMRAGQLGAVAMLLGPAGGALAGVADASCMDPETANSSHA